MFGGSGTQSLHFSIHMIISYQKVYIDRRTSGKHIEKTQMTSSWRGQSHLFRRCSTGFLCQLHSGYAAAIMGLLCVKGATENLIPPSIASQTLWSVWPCCVCLAAKHHSSEETAFILEPLETQNLKLDILFHWGLEEDISVWLSNEWAFVYCFTVQVVDIGNSPSIYRFFVYIFI